MSRCSAKARSVRRGPCDAADAADVESIAQGLAMAGGKPDDDEGFYKAACLTSTSLMYVQMCVAIALARSDLPERAS